MKVSIEHGAFAAAVGRAAKALPTRSATPALSGLLVRADDDTVEISGFDFGMAVAATAPAAVAAPGLVLVSGGLLAQIVRVLPKLPVELSADDGVLELRCGPYQYTLQCMNAADYPELPPAPTVAGSVPAGALATAIGQTAVAAGQDETLPSLTGVRLEFGPALLRVVSTDQYRLAVRDLAWRAVRDVGGLDPDPDALVPARSLLEAVRLLDPATDVAVGVGDGLIGLEAGGMRVSLRQLDGAFVKYAKVFPEQFAGHVILETRPLIEAVRATALVAERNTPVRLAFEPGRVTVAAAAGDQTAASVALDANYGGERLTLAANPQYLLDGLGALATPYTRLSFTTATKPAVLYGMLSADAVADESYRYLFLPVRITG